MNPKQEPGFTLPMLGYLRELNTPRIVLWCYLIWYFGVLARYFDPSPSLWLNSLGIAAIIGTGLYLSTSRAGTTPVRLGKWQVVRLYLMPLCVSSFAALIKGRGFWLVFHPTLADNLKALIYCGTFLFVVFAVKHSKLALVRPLIAAQRQLVAVSKRH